MQDDPVRKWKVGVGEWDDSLRKIGHLRSKCYGRITRLIPFFRCTERYFQAFNCNSPGVSGGVSIPIKQPFQAELAYAWFVASGTVEAKGMNVQAESEAGLVIRYGTGTWGTSATATTTKDAAAKLRPASTTDSKTWYHASADAASASAAKQDTRETIAEANYGDYFLVEEFEIRSSSESALVTGLYAKSVTVTNFDKKPMNTALRVGIAYRTAKNSTITEDTTDKFVIFAPVEVGTGDGNIPSYTYKVYTGKNDETGTSVTALKADAGTATNAKLVDQAVSLPADKDSGIKVQVYVWYEGEDHNLYSDNYHSDDLDVTVKFENISTAAADAVAGG